MTGRTKGLLIGGGALVFIAIIALNITKSSGGKIDVPGKVIRLAVKEGQRVKRGQFLLQLDDTQYRAEVANTEAALQGARSNLRQAEAAFAQSDAALKRKESLFDQKLVSPEELDVA